LSAEERAAAVRSFLDSYYPIAAPWERPTGDAVSGEPAADAFAAPHSDQPEQPKQPE
jgi:hypothetical protein